MRILSLLSLALLSLPVVGQSPQPVVIDIHIVVTVTVSATPVPPGPTPIPPPNPVPVPVPPGPTDTLASNLSAAGIIDKFPAASFVSLSKGFSDCADVVKTATTASALQTQLTRTLLTAVPAGIPKNVRMLLAAELDPLNTLLPASAPDAVITDSIRATVSALFLRLSESCLKASK